MLPRSTVSVGKLIVIARKLKSVLLKSCQNQKRLGLAYLAYKKVLTLLKRQDL